MVHVPIPVLLDLYRGGAAGPPDRLTGAELATLLPAVRRLSRGLTGARGLVGQPYLNDDALRAAYLLYYWPVSFAQCGAALSLSGATGTRALDLGAGPGPASFALAQAGYTEVVAAEPAREARALTQRLAQRLRAPVSTLPWRAGDPIPPGPWDVIYAGHLVNELWAADPDPLARRRDLILQALASLRPNGRLILVEPAPHAINRDLLALRDALHAAGVPIAGPCRAQSPCPALAQGLPCHAELRWDIPPLVAQIATAAHIDKASLAYGWLALGGPPPPSSPDLVRVVSEKVLNRAGRERVLLCAPGGRWSLSALGRSSNEPWRDAWRRLARGDLISVTSPQPRESGWGLTPDSTLTIVQAGGAAGAPVVVGRRRS